MAEESSGEKTADDVLNVFPVAGQDPEIQFRLQLYCLCGWAGCVYKHKVRKQRWMREVVCIVKHCRHGWLVGNTFYLDGEYLTLQQHERALRPAALSTLNVLVCVRESERTAFVNGYGGRGSWGREWKKAAVRKLITCFEIWSCT